MKLDDVIISKAIIDRYTKKLLDCLEVDVAVAGAGPAGLTAGYFIAKSNKKVAIFESKLSVGGGMWGGGMMFNEIVVQDKGKEILDEFGVKTELYQPGYYTADSIETISSITSAAVKARAKIFNLITVEDVMLQDERVTGLVLNWGAVKLASLHVDPLTIRAKFVIEATGHAIELLKILEKKVGKKLKTPSGGIEGERPMWAEVGENLILNNTREIFPGVWVVGMAANAAYGAPRMGPIFGGMLLSGKHCAQKILELLP
ncbi:MAG: sulfide-dependent adenosine diphosphate thiazole synthase [bacterium]|nr:sulfide-dependent adenosine diphosphate thiazole synthase [bacterium]